ncbi:unnamed protein product [Prunus armeniaca]|uniref:Leucine-rich repeat-containing N-terminal plant-type domain-containing protein n=1 Tax=Prunus armeniaca TaxID=36596 RepID=A0A6J5TRG6_PRUAR|nr:unnamed protein product [Prunus armeniaca]
MEMVLLVKILTIFTAINFLCNKFSGQITEEIGGFKSLYILNLSNNAFTGAIPPSLSNMRKLESSDLSVNSLSGQIPAEFAKFTFLSFLNLSNNHLVGRIPHSTQFSTLPKSSFEGNKDLRGPPLTADDIAAGFSPPLMSNGRRVPNSVHDQIDWEVLKLDILLALELPLGPLCFARDELVFQSWGGHCLLDISSSGQSK